jgi:hypothetical protein
MLIISLNKNKYNNKFAKQNVALFLIADPIYAHPPVHRWQIFYQKTQFGSEVFHHFGLYDSSKEAHFMVYFE